MKKKFIKAEKIKGELNFWGDKSVSHRALIFAALADGESEIINLSHGEDVKSTLRCLNSLGVEEHTENGRLIIGGLGFKGLQPPEAPLDAGNSGTTARLLSGILAMQDFDSEITGDESLSARPMKRIIEPLRKMGAVIESAENDLMPLRFFASPGTHPVEYRLPVPSAQVKSAVLLAGLFHKNFTSVIENIPSRDHTERMLRLQIEEYNEGLKISSSKKYYPKATKYEIPGDISSAAFFIVFALNIPDSELVVKNILLNEGRTGFIEILQKMGAHFKFDNFKMLSNEFAGDLHVIYQNLKNVEIPKEKMPSIIDEIPILAVAGLFAEGDFEIRNASELRVKECDRINAICRNMEKLGVDVTEYPDGFRLGGEIKNKEVTFDSYGDHRIAMAFSVLSSILGGCCVENYECISISNPHFDEQLELIL